MNQLCFLANLTSSDFAAWAQAIVSTIAIVVGAGAIVWQTSKTRSEQNQQDALRIDGLARLVIHLRDCAREARLEKTKLARFPPGHPAEPSSRFNEIAEAIRRFPLESAPGELGLDVLLTVRRTIRELESLACPEPELDVNRESQSSYEKQIEVLDAQIGQLRLEARRLMRGERLRHAAGLPE